MGTHSKTGRLRLSGRHCLTLTYSEVPSREDEQSRPDCTQRGTQDPSQQNQDHEAEE